MSFGVYRISSVIFQSTLPRGSDNLHLSRRYFRFLFQSTLPRGSDTETSAQAEGSAGISIHAPSRERQFGTNSPSTIFLYFNPRSLAGATLSAELYCSCCNYFNPRSLAGATINQCIDNTRSGISIHAPSRERHDVVADSILSVFISIHAPSRERQSKHLDLQKLLPFQSTLPRGSDKLHFLENH